MSDYTCFSKVGLKIELERIEALLRRALISGAIALAGFAGPIVANEAAGAALAALPDGKEVFVLSHRSIWTKRNGVPGTQGVPPLAAHEVIATTDGTGVLVRTNYSDPALRIGINFIHIDPGAAFANDENDGLTALTPLKTGKELFRRWGWGAQVEVGPNLATSVDGYLEIRVHSDLVAPDTLDFNVNVTLNGSLRVRGGVKTILRTSTITAPPIAMNSAAPLGGTRLRLTDGALANWAAFMGTNIRGQFMDGPAATGTFLPQLDVPAGPGAVDCSACQTTGLGFIAPTTVTPINGNTYQVQQLITVNFGTTFEFNGAGAPAIFSGNFIDIVDCHIPPAPSFAFNWSPVTAGGVLLNFYQCTIDRYTFLYAANFLTFVACYFTDGIINNGGSASIQGGGAKKQAATVQPTFDWLAPYGFSIDADFVSSGMPIRAQGDTTIINAAVWDCAANIFNPGAHGILVGFGSQSRGRGHVLFQGRVWGANNGGVGLRIGAGCSGTGAPQNITGAAGDLALAGQIGPAATCVYWDQPTSTYLPVGGMLLDWVTLGNAKNPVPVLGYGGGAHWPDQDAHWDAAEAN